MKIIATTISDIKIIEPKVFNDPRGFFLESYNQKALSSLLGSHEFVQDNHSSSVKNVLRGLHYQIQNPQGKLVRVVRGEVFDVAVDMRQKSATFGKWVGTYLSEDNKYMLWVPPGFAHGFLAVSERADLLYKTTDFYNPAAERCLRWDDPKLSIPWPIQGPPLLSPKDAEGNFLDEAEVFL